MSFPFLYLSHNIFENLVRIGCNVKVMKKNIQIAFIWRIICHRHYVHWQNFKSVSLIMSIVGNKLFPHFVWKNVYLALIWEYKSAIFLLMWYWTLPKLKLWICPVIHPVLIFHHVCSGCKFETRKVHFLTVQLVIICCTLFSWIIYC